MAIARNIQGWIEKGDFDSIEDAWLSHAATDATDLGYFVGIARALVGTGEDERSRFLLQLLDGELRESGAWGERLELLQGAGSLFLAPEDQHPTILGTLRALYAEHSCLEGLLDAVGLHRAPQDIPKTWEKVRRLTHLLAFDVGSVVWMEGRGAGRVVEVNLGLESFKVDFERFSGLSVGFRAAAKVLKPLSEEHILRRKMEDPDSLRTLAASDPPQLLGAVLTSYDRPLTASEIREILSGVLGEKSWTSFWGSARRHPQVVAGTSGRQTYTWVESSAGAIEAMWDAYRKADPRKRIDLLRREGGRDEQLRQRMADDLARVATESYGADPGLAFEIWFALERSGGAPKDVPWSPETLLDTVDPLALFAGVEDRLLRERGYTMLRERTAEWLPVYLELLLREEDPRALDVLTEAVRRERPRELERFVDGLLAQPHRAPAAFVWLAERAAEEEALRQRNPLRLLQQILSASSRDEFASLRTRLKPLADSGGTLPRLLGHLEPDQAALAEDAIHRAPTLEPYQREQLIAALHLRFADLRRDEAPLYATPEAIEAKRAELQELLAKEIPANRKAIEEARALGDLRENFEYKSARQRHEYLSARASKLNQELSRVQPIAAGAAGSGEVRIGSRARLSNSGGRERTFTILGPWESDPEKDVISYLSDLGKELVGKRPGETIEISGELYTLRSIEPYR